MTSVSNWLKSASQIIRSANRKRLYRRRMQAAYPYQDWIRQQEDLERHRPTCQTSVRFRVLIVTTGERQESDRIRKTIESLQKQDHPQWSHQLIDLSKPLPEQTRHIEGWCLTMGAGDTLHPSALSFIAHAIQEDPEVSLVYTDSDEMSERDERSNPLFKPDWNPDLQLSTNYIDRIFAVHLPANTIRIASSTTADLWGYEVINNAFPDLTERSVKHISHVLAHRATPRPELDHDYVEALLRSRGNARTQGIEPTAKHGILHIRHTLEEEPLASIIICTRDQVGLLRTCVSSISGKTTYKNHEIIIVDNGSKEPETLSYLAQIRAQSDDITVIRDDSPFNYPALNNTGAALARGSVIVLLNNDIEVIAGGWLTELVSQAMRPEIGCVGARLLYPDDTVQHAGILIGGGGENDGPAIATHYFKGLDRELPGYAKRAIATQRVSAVTGACLAIRKEIYMRVGGLDAVNLPVAFNDVDLCLRVREAGLHNLYAPQALLYHHESFSRGRDLSPEKARRLRMEQAYMLSRWGRQLARDPYYNDNLDSTKGYFFLKNDVRTQGTRASIP